MDENIFHWRVKTGLTSNFIMYYFLQGTWIMKNVNCFCPMVLSTCHNWELLIAPPHRPLSFNIIKTTTNTAFLISNTVVPNPYSHSKAFDPNLLHPYLKFQVHLTDFSQSDVQMLYRLQIDYSIGSVEIVAELRFSKTS